MTGLLVFAVVPADSVDRIALASADGFPPGLGIVEAAKFAAVVGAAPDGNLKGRDRTALLPWLLTSQKVIDHLLARGPVLPVAFGTVLESADRTRHMLEAGTPVLRAAFEEIASCYEMNLSVRWPLDVVIAEVLAGFSPALRAAAGRPEARNEAARQALATALAEGVERQRRRVRLRAAEHLQAVAQDLVLSAPVEPEGVFDMALLLNPRAAEDLDGALATLDREFENRLAFRLVGPLAPYSFASVQVHLAPQAAVANAWDVLGLAPGAAVAALKTAYHHALRRVHPDLVPDGVGDAEVEPADDTEGMRVLTAAYRILEAEFAPVSVRRQETEPLA
ncbi:MAG: hypothetical protein H6R00_1424 [Proteobacteria bacterium]|nr:hypothetical protein [Pseudomonadota bacterium]